LFTDLAETGRLDKRAGPFTPRAIEGVEYSNKQTCLIKHSSKLINPGSVVRNGVNYDSAIEYKQSDSEQEHKLHAYAKGIRLNVLFSEILRSHWARNRDLFA
jgi:hypothetical protein